MEYKDIKIYDEKLLKSRFEEMATTSNIVNSIKLEEKRKEQFILRKNIMNNYKNERYNIFLLAYDIAHSNYCQIRDSISRGKVSIDEYLKIATDYLNNKAIDYIVQL